MKVVTNEAYSEQYQELFAGLSEAVKKIPGYSEVMTIIENLTQYYRSLDYYIKAANDGKVPALPFKYYRVPLDEKPFKVDMNSRTITIPEEFQRYGVGVRGDANAEIIIFEVDRLYDLMDLDIMSRNGQCWVQWVNTATRDQGNSPTILGDAVDEKLYLAWVITSEMTKGAGNIEFALRFFTTDVKDGKTYIDYSISTQRASVAVKSTLDLDVLDAEVDTNLQQLIISRPIYSGVINSMNGAAPKIITNLEAGEYNLETSGLTYEDYNEVFPEGVKKFSVEAEPVEEGDTIVYKWYRGREIVQNPLTNDEYQDDDVKFGDEATDSDYIATTAGTYFCKIGNNNRDTGTRWVDSATVVIPGATNITYAAKELPMFTYSVTENKNGVEYKEYNFEVKGANGKVKYDWHVTELNGDPISDVNQVGIAEGGLFIPIENKEFKISAEAANHLNNTVSNTVKTPYETTYRAVPTTPVSVDAEYSQITPNESFTITATPTFEGPSAKHSDEWVYNWSYYSSATGSTVAVPASWIQEKGKVLKPNLTSSSYRPSGTVQTIQYDFTCRVKHRIYDTSTAGKYVESAEKASNVVSVAVTANTITEVKE